MSNIYELTPQESTD